MNRMMPLNVLLPAALLAGLLLAGDARAQTATQPSLFERASRQVEQQEQALVALRHDLHRHPELSGAEVRTAGVVARRLADLGFEVRSGIGGHGVVGVLRNFAAVVKVFFRSLFSRQ